MPDQNEILLQEVAILRQEIAHLQSLIEKANESIDSLNLAFLKRLDALALLVRDIQARIPPLPQ